MQPQLLLVVYKKSFIQLPVSCFLNSMVVGHCKNPHKAICCQTNWGRFKIWYVGIVQQFTALDDRCRQLTLMTNAYDWRWFQMPTIEMHLVFLKIVWQLNCRAKALVVSVLLLQSTEYSVYRISSKHCGKYSYYVITLLLKWSNCVCIYTEIVTELSKSVIVSSTSVCNLKILLYKLVVCELVQKLSYKLFHHLSK